MVLTDRKTYDGSLIHKRFAYRFYNKGVIPIGNIVAFRGPMEVTVNLIDLEDSMSNDYIYSEDAINFCWEIPVLNNQFGAVCFQRLFNTQMANILQPLVGAPIEVDGDDLKVHKEHTQGGIVQKVGKASVSITYVNNDAALGHTGINIIAGRKAPAFAFSTNLTDDQADQFMLNVTKMFYELCDDLFVATAKVQV